MKESKGELEMRIPKCPICGNLMKLMDMREVLEKNLGRTYQDDDDAPYKIICCNSVLRMENKAKRREIVRLMRLYYD